MLQPKGVVENLVEHGGWAAQGIHSWDTLRHSSALLAQGKQELLLSHCSLKKPNFPILIFSISSCIPM